MIQPPICRHCGQAWTPPVNVVAANAYCGQCSSSRQEPAKEAFGLRRLTAEDFDEGGYTIMRRSRCLGRPRSQEPAAGTVRPALEPVVFFIDEYADIIAIADRAMADLENSTDISDWSQERLLAHYRAMITPAPTDDEIRLARLLDIADEAQRHPEQCVDVTGWSRERLLAHLRASPTVPSQA